MQHKQGVFESQMFSKRFLIIGFIFFYLSFLIATMPVSLVWQWTSDYVPQNNIRLSDFQGTLWKGQAELETQGEPFELEWRVNATKLLLGKLEVQLKVEQASLKLDGLAWVSVFRRFQIENLTGFVDDKLFSMVDLPRGTTIKGRLWLDSMQLSGNPESSIESLSGQARWSGGPVQFLAGRTTLSAEVPQLFADITSADEINLVVVDSNQQEWIKGKMDQDGWLNLQILQNVADVLKLPIQGGSQNILFEMKQKVY